MLKNPWFLTLWHLAVTAAGIVIALNTGDLHTAVGVLTGTGLINAASPSPFATSK